jgi:hypothetical protein
MCSWAIKGRALLQGPGMPQETRDHYFGTRNQSVAAVWSTESRLALLGLHGLAPEG